MSKQKIYVLGTDLVSTTLLSPLLKNSFVDTEGNEVPVDWEVAVYGMQGMEVDSCKNADGIVLCFDPTNESSPDLLKKMAHVLPRICPLNFPIACFGMYSSERQDIGDNSDVHNQVRDYCGTHCRASMALLDVSNKENAMGFVTGFLYLAQRKHKNEDLKFIRALYDNDIENSYPFRVNDIFVLEEEANSDGWSQGSFFGQYFFYSASYGEQVTIDSELLVEMADPRKIIGVLVEGTEERVTEKGKKYTVYVFRVRTSSSEWVTYKRYSELHDFNEYLKKQYSHIDDWHYFPKKTVLAASDEKVAKRRVKIEKFFNWVLTEPRLKRTFIEEKFVRRSIDQLLERAKHVPDPVLDTAQNPDNIVQRAAVAPASTKTDNKLNHAPPLPSRPSIQTFGSRDSIFIANSESRDSFATNDRASMSSITIPEDADPEAEEKANQGPPHDSTPHVVADPSANVPPTRPRPPSFVKRQFRSSVGEIPDPSASSSSSFSSSSSKPPLPERQKPQLPERNQDSTSSAPPVATPQEEEKPKTLPPDTNTQPVEEPQPVEASPASSTSSRQFVKAEYEFAARDDTELSFAASTVIEVVGDIDADWGYGYLNGKAGAFPKAYIVPAQVDDPSAYEKPDNAHYTVYPFST